MFLFVFSFCYASFTFQDVCGKAMEFLLIISKMSGELKNVLPYFFMIFLFGLALGLLE